MPVYMRPRALGTESGDTSLMMVAVASAQNPPTTTPSRARASISSAKLGLSAIRMRESSITSANTIST
ncbi:hypothetical protein D3C76_1714270 [compost metagenome]